MLAVRTPGAPQATRTLARPAIPPSPLRDRVSYSDHVRFRGYFPVHFILAYNLPVYASQLPLPDTTQRLGSRLLARLYRGRPSQATEFNALARRNSHTTGHTGPYHGGSIGLSRHRHEDPGETKRIEHMIS